MGRSNLKGQFIYAINCQFGEGGKDKHALKNDTNITPEERMHNVYSFKEAKSLRDVACQLGVFCQKEYNIKYVKDIKSQHINSFLEQKKETCNNNTIKNYISRLTKMQYVVNRTYNIDVEWKGHMQVDLDPAKGEKLRNVHMTDSDFQKIMEHSKDSQSEGRLAIILTKEFGFRVDEMAKGLRGTDINLTDNTIRVIGKNGKIRFIPILPNQMEFAKELKEKFGNEKIINIKPGSVNQFLRREFKALGMQQYLDAKTNVHSIRKNFADNRFCQLRDYYQQEKKYTYEKAKEKAAEEVSLSLGHSKARGHDIKLLQTYVPSFFK